MTSAGASHAPRAIPFGKYLLLERLHVGKSSEVFLAKTFGVEGFEKFVAVKRMRANLAHDEAATQRFIDEAKLLGSLSHAHITPIYELGKVGATHYTVMEHVWGQSLATIIARRRQQRDAPVGMAAFVGARLCDALHYAHTRRSEGTTAPVYHGNLEPGNVLVSYEGTVKLIDFGLPGSEGDDADALLDGRFAYRSPEQLAGAPLDARSEVFAIAACVWELLTGRRPDEEPPRAESALSEAERALRSLLSRCMERDRRSRPESVAELQAEFLRSLSVGGQPFTTSRAAEWMRAEFDETLERSKRRLNLYAALRSPEDIESIRPPGSMEDDPFANEPTVITEPTFNVESEGGWDDAPTQIYFSSDALTSSERPAFAITAAHSTSVKLAPDALTPEPEEQRRERARRRASRRAPPEPAPSPAPQRSASARRRAVAGISKLWYVAGALALVAIAVVIWLAMQHPGEGQIEIREREGRPAEAWVDGVMRGQTPMRLEHVEIGARRIELRAAGQPGASTEVVVRENVTALVELSVAGESQSPADPNRPGVLIVTTIPWAHVHLDGRPTGRRTPIPDLRVSPGRHLLRLVADDGRSIEEEIFVRPGESLRIVRRFEN